MKVGDLVVMKHKMGYWRGMGVIIDDDVKNPWEECVRVCWYTMEGSGNHNALHRRYDLEPAF